MVNSGSRTSSETSSVEAPAQAARGPDLAVPATATVTVIVAITLVVVRLILPLLSALSLVDAACFSASTC